MKKALIALATALMIFSLPALAQEKGREGGGSRGVGGGRPPARGPAPVKAKAAPRTAAPEPAGHPAAPHVHANGKWVGHESGPNDPRYHVAKPSNTGALREGSAGVMSGALPEATGSDSDSAGSFSAFFRRTMITSPIGSGTATRSLSMKIRITSAFILRTTSVWAPTLT